MFFRDPNRQPPDQAHVILSPADGQIRYIHRIDQNELPVVDKKGHPFTTEHLAGTPIETQPCYHVGIEMNLIDVHVNRIPINGIVRDIIRLPGRFMSLRNPLSIVENVRVTTLIENEQFIVAMIQISSRLVRCIMNHCRIGEKVLRGERFGMIRFGSQVDILFPASSSMQIRVQTGERVKAGETVIAKYQI
jgi:phosphatidylserine decarboxylase